MDKKRYAIRTLETEIHFRWKFEAEKTPNKKKLRKAQAKDIRIGRIVWLYVENTFKGSELEDKDDKKEWHLMEIVEVLCPSDKFKAFCAEDGCRYGLHNLFVERVVKQKKGN